MSELLIGSSGSSVTPDAYVVPRKYGIEIPTDSDGDFSPMDPDDFAKHDADNYLMGGVPHPRHVAASILCHNRLGTYVGGNVVFDSNVHLRDNHGVLLSNDSRPLTFAVGGTASNTNMLIFDPDVTVVVRDDFLYMFRGFAGTSLATQANDYRAGLVMWKYSYDTNQWVTTAGTLILSSQTAGGQEQLPFSSDNYQGGGLRPVCSYDHESGSIFAALPNRRDGQKGANRHAVWSYNLTSGTRSRHGEVYSHNYGVISDTYVTKHSVAAASTRVAGGETYDVLTGLTKFLHYTAVGGRAMAHVGTGHGNIIRLDDYYASIAAADAYKLQNIL